MSFHIQVQETMCIVHAGFDFCEITEVALDHFSSRSLFRIMQEERTLCISDWDHASDNLHACRLVTLGSNFWKKYGLMVATKKVMVFILQNFEKGAIFRAGPNKKYSIFLGTETRSTQGKLCLLPCSFFLSFLKIIEKRIPPNFISIFQHQLQDFSSQTFRKKNHHKTFCTSHGTIMYTLKS